jgi:hypothetical protein
MKFERGRIRRLVLLALNDLGTFVYNYHDIVKQIIEIEPKLTVDDLLGHSANCRLNNSSLLEAVEYLNDKGLIEYHPDQPGNAPAPVLFRARINAYGKDVIDDPNRLDKEIPIVNQSINISGGQAAISGVGNATFNVNQCLPDDEETKKDIEELREYITSKPKLLEWVLGIAPMIPGLLELLKAIGVLK